MNEHKIVVKIKYTWAYYVLKFALAVRQKWIIRLIQDEFLAYAEIPHGNKKYKSYIITISKYVNLQ